jgi:copper chaperone
MIKLSIPDMSCGHCVKTITEAIKGLDADARVTCDIDKKQVTVDSKANPDLLIQALVSAGYPAAS